MSTPVPPGYKLTEAGIIPEDWQVTTVGAEFSIQLGKMLDAERDFGELKPYLGNRAVQWGRIDLSDLKLVALSSTDIQRFRLSKGDLLVCEGGEVGRAAIWDSPIDECYFQKALHRLRSKRGYNTVLLLNLLRRLASSGLLLDFVTQTSIAHLPKDKFETLPIPLPSDRPEQEAIAEALSDADAYIESLEQLIAKKRQIKQGAMQELLTGKTRLVGFERNRGNKDSEIGVIPKDWQLDYIENISDITTGGKNTQDSVDDGQYPFFVRSQTVELINTFSFDGEAILTAGDGVGTGKVFHYINGKFDAHQRVYRISQFGSRSRGYSREVGSRVERRA